MKQETEVRILKELFRQLDEGVNVDAGVRYRAPTDSYVSPELAEKEWASFFQGHPQLIGLTGDIPEPGNFFTTDDFGTPILATRDDNGNFRAFLNACRQEGVYTFSGPRAFLNTTEQLGGTFQPGDLLSLVPATSGGTVYYTTDGTDPADYGSLGQQQWVTLVHRGAAKRARREPAGWNLMGR